MAEQNKKTGDTAKQSSVAVTATVSAEQYAKIRRARHLAEYEKRSDFVRDAVVAHAEKMLAKYDS